MNDKYISFEEYLEGKTIEVEELSFEELIKLANEYGKEMATKTIIVQQGPDDYDLQEVELPNE